jgi:hypothetical protein
MTGLVECGARCGFVVLLGKRHKPTPLRRCVNVQSGRMSRIDLGPKK